MKKLLVAILSISVFLSSCSLSTGENSSDFPFKSIETKKVKALKDTEIREVIDLSVSWFKNIADKSGKLVYQLNPVDNIISNDENILRQAGAFFVITEIYKRDTDNIYDLDSLIRNYADFFSENTIKGRHNSINFRCLKDKKGDCSLGASALAFSGFVNYSKRNPSFYDKHKDLILGYKDFILAMRHKEIGFASKYLSNGKVENIKSAFYNGEAFLALAIYYNFSFDENVLNELLLLWPYLKENYSISKDANFYLWGMLALKELKYVVSADEYIPFVNLYTKSRLKKMTRSKISDSSFCALSEGLSASVYLLSGNVSSEDETYFSNELNFWLKFNLEFQIKNNDFFEFTIKNLRNSKGGFAISKEDPTLRIDYTQHCLNAYLIKYIDIDENSF